MTSVTCLRVPSLCPHTQPMAVPTQPKPKIVMGFLTLWLRVAGSPDAYSQRSSPRHCVATLTTSCSSSVSHQTPPAPPLVRWNVTCSWSVVWWLAVSFNSKFESPSGFATVSVQVPELFFCLLWACGWQTELGRTNHSILQSAWRVYMHLENFECYLIQCPKKYAKGKFQSFASIFSFWL